MPRSIKWTSKQGAAVAVSVLLIVVSVLVIAQMYFTHSENQALHNGCYDRGGFPVVEKTKFAITYFDCDLNR